MSKQPHRPLRTPGRVGLIMQALASGNTQRAAAAYGGISKQAFYEWQADPTPLPWLEGEDAGRTFADLVTHAEGQAEISMQTRVFQAAPVAWQAAAWWLERRRHGDFGVRRQVELSGPEGAPLFGAVQSDHEKRILRDLINEHLAKLEKVKA